MPPGVWQPLVGVWLILIRGRFVIVPEVALENLEPKRVVYAEPPLVKFYSSYV